jgi:hypothetical protein
MEFSPHLLELVIILGLAKVQTHLIFYHPSYFKLQKISYVFEEEGKVNLVQEVYQL